MGKRAKQDSESHPADQGRVSKRKPPSVKAELHRRLTGVRNHLGMFQKALQGEDRKYNNEELAHMVVGLDRLVEGIQTQFAQHKPQKNPHDFIQFPYALDQRVTDFYFSFFPTLSRSRLPHMSEGLISSQVTKKILKHVRAPAGLRDEFKAAFPTVAAAMEVDRRGLQPPAFTALMKEMRRPENEPKNPSRELLDELKAEALVIDETAPLPVEKAASANGAPRLKRGRPSKNF